MCSVLAAAILLGGCAATKVADDALGDMTRSALEAVGLKKPDVPEIPQLPQADALRLPRKVELKVYAGPQLNHDEQGQPLSLVVRIYQLKSSAAFLQAPYEAFAAAGVQRNFLGDDVIDVQEVTLVPGQRYAVDEQVPRDAAAVGVVALFNAPASQRWKFAFDAESAEKSGVVIGAHGCALSVTRGVPLNVEFDASMLAGVRCGS